MLVKYIVAIVVVILLEYLAFAFVAQDIWWCQITGQDGFMSRLVFLILGLGLSGMAAAAIIELRD